MDETRRARRGSGLDEHGIKPPPAFAIERADAPDGAVVLALSGEIDMATASEFRTAVAGALQERPRLLVLDLGAATFMDSSMLKELLRANADARAAECTVVLAGAQPAIRRLLELTKTSALFVHADDRDAALLAAGD